MWLSEMKGETKTEAAALKQCWTLEGDEMTEFKEMCRRLAADFRVRYAQQTESSMRPTGRRRVRMTYELSQ
jgi:hypothetical protein